MIRSIYLFVLMFSIVILLSQSLPHPVFANEAIITADHVNVRTGPSIHYEQIGQVHTDEEYPIIQQQNGWVEIEYQNQSGWITSEYVHIQQETESNGNLQKTNIIIQNDNTHIREGASSSYPIVDFVNKGEELSIISQEGNWYEVKDEQIHGYVLKDLVDERNETTSTNGFDNKTIVIDAGHGGKDVGAIGASGTYEKDFTFQTALALKEELNLLGANVILTRDEDEFISLNSRASLANRYPTDAFISLHYNSTLDMPDVTGVGTYFYHDQNKSLAKSIQQNIIKETNAKNRDISFGDFQVMRQSRVPSILVELEFISNHEKEQLLLTNGYQKKLVTGIVKGLQFYFSSL
ncbi:N-acetylmuramoyl-L-alanine amidase [Oceanobacillus halotolerans]|uniref:N-acetylmuramoyl-L-alanine amidase n=1 Tax=Oceanobacillus halotolerans TaxID=2663380 RepID=UPI0013D926BA|nr:N-acetylmuramoyl-L-alanine amidase [Oceanobacillus halotolerans]